MTLGKLKRQLQQDVQDIKDAWANGNYTGESAEATLQLNAEAIGKVSTCESIIEFIETEGGDEDVE